MQKFIINIGDTFYYHGDIYLLTNTPYMDAGLHAPTYYTKHLEYIRYHQDNGSLIAITISYPHTESADFYLIKRADFAPIKCLNKFSLVND